MSSFYEVFYDFFGLSCKTTILADGIDQIQRILGDDIIITSYKVLK